MRLLHAGANVLRPSNVRALPVFLQGPDAAVKNYNPLMLKENHVFRINNILAGAIVAALAATQAHAAAVVVPQPPELVGGGATLPAIAYVGSGWLAGTSADVGVPSRLSTTNPNVVGGAVNLTPADADSLFGVWATGTTTAAEYISTVDNGGTPVITSTGTKTVKTTNPDVSFCQTGSGPGRNILEGAASPKTACTDYNTSPTGFGAPVDAQFIASDAPLMASDYSTFITNRGATKTEPVAFPAIAGGIAVVYNATGTGFSTASTSHLNLTESQICQIFAGQISTWGQLLNTSNTTPITIVYREDNSGTAFNFTNHLAKVCPTAIGGAVSGVFQTNSNFSSLAKNNGTNASYGDASFLGSSPNGSQLISGSNPPVAAVGENGNGAVVTEVNATPGAIGYSEVADAVSRAAEAGSSIGYATVSIEANIPTTYYCTFAPTSTFIAKPTCSGKGNKLVTVKAQTFKAWNPISGLSKSIKVNFTSDKVLVGSTTGGELEPVSTVLGGAAPVHPGCIQIVDPATYATPALSKGDYTNYPIISISNLMGFNTGNSITVNTVDGSGNPVATTTDVHAFVASLLSSPYSLSSKVKTIGTNTGYATLVPILDTNAAGTTTNAAGNKVAPKPATVVADCILQ